MKTRDLSVVQPHFWRQDGLEAAVVMLHGFHGVSPGTWSVFGPLLAADPLLRDWDVASIGYATRLLPDVTGLWSADADLNGLARLLREHLRQAPFSRYGALALIAHSMGGLIVQRALLDDAALAGRVSHVVLYGTPSNGLRKATPFRFLKRQVRQMARGGLFIRQLRAGWATRFTPHTPFEFLSVAGDQDEFVPRTSSIDPFEDRQRAVIPGNHVTILQPVDRDDLRFVVARDLIARGAHPRGPLSSARIAVERREFGRARELFAAHADELDEDAAVQYALALESLGAREDALEVLRARAGSDELDALGTLAGRVKRRWLTERRRADGQEAQDLYEKGFALARKFNHHDQASYHAVNVAFMRLAFGHDLGGAQTYAAWVLEHCDARDATVPSPWTQATRAEAALYLGRFDEALAGYTEALMHTPALTPRQYESIYKQAHYALRALNQPALEVELDRRLGVHDAIVATAAPSADSG